MTNISELITALAFSQLMLLGVYFATRYDGTLARLISLYSLCLGAYILASLPFIGNNPVSFYILLRLATLTPFILWGITYLLFVDSGKIHIGIWIAIAYFMIARGFGIVFTYFDPTILDNRLNLIIIQVIPQLLMLGFSLHSVYLAVNGYKNDLVEQRRQLRVIFVICMGALLVIVVGTGFVNLFQRVLGLPNFLNFPSVPVAIIALYIFIIAALFMVRVFRLSNEALSLIASEHSQNKYSSSLTKTKTTIDPALLEKVRILMEEDRLYAKTGLTISDLADALSMQEYRVRHLINQQLNYRNFNQFLNNYRIEDAAEKLRNRDNSISWIALDVGYASLSVFNKAFKERFGVTPTEFRNNEKGSPIPITTDN